MGFKQMGDTVWILFDYKMDFARKLQRFHNVNEVGLKIDTARKPLYSGIQKKFATTPKKIFNVNQPKYAAIKK
jgi:hypothetical protein